MRIAIVLLLYLCSHSSFSQGNIDTLNFEGGVELAHFNFLNSSLSMTEKEQGEFWVRYEEMGKAQAILKYNQQSLKNSILYGFLKSDDEIVSIIERIAEVDIEKIYVKRDFIIDCVEILDPKRAIKYSLLEKQFRKKAKSIN